MSTSKLQMCREGNHTRIDIKKDHLRNILNLKLQYMKRLLQIRRKNILWMSEWILPQKNPNAFLFSVPILLEPWTREFLLHQIWSCITISGTFILYLLWPCLHSSLLLSPVLQQTLILCLITAKDFSFCVSPVLMAHWMVSGNGERIKILSGTSSY